MQPKGQLISKADWRAIDSPKKRDFFFFLFYYLRQTNQIRPFVFLGESTAPQSAFWFYLTFSYQDCVTQGSKNMIVYVILDTRVYKLEPSLERD